MSRFEDLVYIYIYINPTALSKLKENREMTKVGLINGVTERFEEMMSR